MDENKCTHRDNPTIGLTFKEQTGCGSSFFSIKFNWHEQVRLVEVFCGSSSKGGCSSNTKMMGRLVSLALQNNVPIEEIVDQLESEICPTARYRAGQDANFKKTGNSSCSKALASAIKKTLQAQEFFERHQDELKKIFSSVEDIRERSIEISKEKITQAKEIIESKPPEYTEIIKPTPHSSISRFDSQPKGAAVMKSTESDETTLQKAVRLGIVPKEEKSKEERQFLLPLDKLKAGNKIIGDEGKGEDYWIERGFCPECRSSVGHSEGCVLCRHCGYSKC